LPYIFPVENLHTSDFPGDNVEYEHTFVGCQDNIPMTGAEAAFWFGLRVEHGAEIIPAAAALQNCQAGDLGSQFGLAFLGQEGATKSSAARAIRKSRPFAVS
jgi:hypothetical protein